MIHDNGQPHNDLTPQTESPNTSTPKEERITNDVRREAEEAMRLYTSLHQSNPTKPESGIFKLGMLLKVEVMGSDTPLYVMPKAEMVVGRADPSSGDLPEIDLTAYAAYQMGISRRHALIKWHNNTLHLVDQGSRNGTFINGSKVYPNSPHKLHDGDEIRMGKMSLRLYFREEPAAGKPD